MIGAADSQCVAFGAGVVDPGPVSEMAGASSCLNSAVTEPLADVRVTHYSHVVPDRFTTELGINTSGAAIDWAVRRLGYRGHAALDRRRRSVAPAACAAPAPTRVTLAPLFLPYLGDGERDDPDLRGAFVGLSLRHDRPALAYAVLEGIALRGAAARSPAWRRPARRVDELRVSGGGGRLAALVADQGRRARAASASRCGPTRRRSGRRSWPAAAAGMGDEVPGDDRLGAASRARSSPPPRVADGWRRDGSGTRRRAPRPRCGGMGVG